MKYSQDTSRYLWTSLKTPSKFSWNIAIQQLWKDGHYWAIMCPLKISQGISGYFGLSQDISDYLMLSHASTGYLILPHAILDYILPSLLISCKLKLFGCDMWPETCDGHNRVLEELLLLKNVLAEFSMSIKKITRRTTGARGCCFLTSVYIK